jgi:hypothetical protein
VPLFVDHFRWCMGIVHAEGKVFGGAAVAQLNAIGQDRSHPSKKAIHCKCFGCERNNARPNVLSFPSFA